MTRQDLILIVDDEPHARAMLAQALGAAGFATLSAPDGESALAMVEQAAPHLVVLDAVMPGLSGFEACRRLKARPEHAHLPVIFTTGLSETEHVIEGLRAGGVDYVTKPIVIDELIARIRVHLSAARLAHSARVALDMAGRSLIAADSAGRLLWGTPQASELLASMFGSADGAPALAAAIAALAARAEDAGGPSSRIDAGGRRLEITYLGRAGPQEVYFRLCEPIEGGEADLLKSSLNLTAREGEVLVWIARGKSNRDISEILNISPRTVNKHLEQVFTKLGVENRAAAASIATRVMAARM
jgi:DNA-binding response OmpR family regulator/DNA-binding CsgD family transcriptional regulator